VKIVAAGDTVPITKYATQLVQNLAKLPGAPAGFAAAYQSNIVTKAENVQAVITQVLLGQGDAAIVYVSDAKSGGALYTIAIPQGANVLATYGGVVVKASALQDAGHVFLSWLTGPYGQAVLGTYGFLPPPS
jgi:molybdate transport system substrate-binding protein